MTRRRLLLLAVFIALALIVGAVLWTLISDPSSAPPFWSYRGWLDL
jgi:hypothetical protein